MTRTTRHRTCYGCGKALDPSPSPFHGPACRRRWILADARAEARELQEHHHAAHLEAARMEAAA